jgi:hypothetical protein
LIDLWKGQYKRVNKLVIFEHDNTDMLKKSENINITKNVKKPKRDKVLLALIVFFCYSVYRMIKTGLKVFFAPVRMKRGRR